MNVDVQYTESFIENIVQFYIRLNLHILELNIK